ncbi:MAG: THUMP domain-containing protein [Pseudomonadota bacterium]
MEHFFATCPRGLESALATELAELSALEIKPVDGGVRFAGAFTLCYAVNLESRIASRVLWRIAEARYKTEQDIYDMARALPWPDWFGPERTIRVNVAAIKSPLRSLDFATLKIKDAACDAFRAASGRRPDVDTHAPDVRIHAFLTATDCTLYLDTSGDALFKRGYRSVTGEAPLRENLAAGILRLSGWQPDMPLLDPMCGSGTFLAEAGMIALDMAPGLNRRFGFEKLNRFDQKVWQALHGRARARKKTSIKTNIYGGDLYGDALKLARANLTALGLENAVSLKQANVLEMPAPADGGIIVTNPPYGVRLSEQQELAEFYPKLGDALKKKFSGWTAYLLTADLRLAKLIRLAASKRTPLFNGALECRLFEFKLVAGSMRK